MPELALLRPTLEAAAARMNISLSCTEAAMLLQYIKLLRHWNRAYNLTSVRDPSQMLTRHVLDCLSVVGPLRRQAGSGSAAILDVGSGGGLPGLVFAMLNPEYEVTCVDTVRKKTAFVQQAVAELGLLNVTVQHARVEQLRIGPFDIVTARAFDSLAGFTGKTVHLKSRAGVWLAMKGKVPTAEIAGLPSDVDVFHVEQLIVEGLDEERCLIWLQARIEKQASL